MKVGRHGLEASINMQDHQAMGAVRLVSVAVAVGLAMFLLSLRCAASDASKNPKEHWAFKPPVRPKLSDVKNKNWVRNPIDQFVLARLEKEKLKPAAEADRVTLLRRLSLDLIGLPPTIAEVD